MSESPVITDYHEVHISIGDTVYIQQRQLLGAFNDWRSEQVEVEGIVTDFSVSGRCIVVRYTDYGIDQSRPFSFDDIGKRLRLTRQTTLKLSEVLKAKMEEVQALYEFFHTHSALFRQGEDDLLTLASIRGHLTRIFEAVKMLYLQSGGQQ